MQNRLFFSLLLLGTLLIPLQSSAKLVIADGGASGYLMENNLPATTLAVAMEADIIKMNLVLTGDGEVLVFSSPFLEYGSNVAEVFPEKIREDQHYYVLDFTIEDIRQLTLTDPKHRFPADLHPRFEITTLQEQLALLRSLEKSLNRSITIAVELVKPWLHRKEKRDLTTAVLTILQQYGYTGQNADTYLLSYEVDELQRIKKELLPQKEMTLKLVQLVDTADGQENMVEEWGEYHSYNYDWIFSNTGLHALARSVTAIAIPKYMLVDAQKKLLLENFVTNAQKLDTMIFTFPVQQDDTSRLPFTLNPEEELEFLYFTVGVDGIFTDFCKDASEFLRNRVEIPAVQAMDSETLPVAPTVLMSSDPLQLTSPLESEFEN